LTVIYIDVLIFVNIVINYFLLLITATLTGSKKKRLRIGLAAVAGSAFALVILLPSLHVLLSLLIRVAGALLMSAVAFGIRGFRRLLRDAAWLFVASTVLAGAVLAAGEWGRSSAFVSKNLGIYIDISPVFLIVTVLAVYLLLCLFELVFRKRTRQDRTCRATVRAGNSTLSFEALLDSGNRLYDAMSGRDAVIVSRKLAKGFLTETQMKALEEESQPGSMAGALAQAGEFRLLPFRSLGGQGLLVAFPASSCEVTLSDGGRRVVDKPWVAFADGAMLGDIEGIISTDAVEV